MNPSEPVIAKSDKKGRATPKLEFVLGLGTSVPGGSIIIDRCLKRIDDDPDLERLGRSEIHSSLPMGQQTFQLFHNAACLVGTRLSASSLLARTQAYESQYGRLRWQKNGPRTLDIDILWARDFRIWTSRLTIPHPGLFERWFAFVPAVESLLDAHRSIPPHLQRLYNDHLSHNSQPMDETGRRNVNDAVGGQLLSSPPNENR